MCSSAQVSLRPILQACIPLSYAAQIPTTSNRDLANVRVSVSNLEQDVRQFDVRFCVSLSLSSCVRVALDSRSYHCARMMAASSHISPAQVKGSAKAVVTVVATQDLQTEDVLLRFKAEAATHIQGSRSISARLMFGNCCFTWDFSNLCVMFFYSFFWCFSCVCVCVCVCASASACDDLVCFASHV